MDVITNATVIEDTIEEIKKLKISVENLSADVNMLIFSIFSFEIHVKTQITPYRKH